MVSTKQALEALETMDQRLREFNAHSSTAYFILQEFISQANTREKLGIAALLREADG